MQYAMRFSPAKTTILLKKNILPSGEEAFLSKEVAGDLSSQQLGLKVGADEEGCVTDGQDILVDEWGRPLVDREIAFLPDPRYRELGHLVFCLLWYGGCFLSILYIALVFLAYEPEQTQTLPFTRIVNPMLDLRLELSCTSPSLSVTRVNYSDPSSMCFNRSATHIPGPHDHPHTHTHRRKFQAQMHHLPAAFTPQPPPVQWLEADAPTPLVTGSNYEYAETIVVPLCHVDDSIYDTNWYWPQFPGAAVMINNISDDNLCSIDVFSTLPNAPSKPIKRLSIEGGIIKTLWLQYTEVRLKHEDKKLDKETLKASFFELDGMRTFVGPATNTSVGTSSIIRFRFTDTAKSVLEYDMRTWVKAGGIFGSLWYLISNYFCFYAAPILLCLVPRDFIADAKAGKLDGYTLNGLAHCWRPTVWLWIGGELVKRVKIATGAQSA